MTKYDIIWIGTSQATGTIVPRRVKAGKTVALVESGRNVLMATRAMKHISRAREKDETAVLVKFLVDADTEQSYKLFRRRC